MEVPVRCSIHVKAAPVDAEPAHLGGEFTAQIWFSETYKRSDGVCDLDS